MDSEKDKGDHVSTVSLTDSSDDENVGGAEPLSSEAPLRLEDFADEFLVDGEGGNFGYDDIMVEVMGDEVFIDGIGSDGTGIDGGNVVRGADRTITNGVENFLGEISNDIFCSEKQQALDKAVGKNAETYLKTSDHFNHTEIEILTKSGNQDSVDAASLLSSQPTKVVECLTDAENNGIPLTTNEVLGSVDSRGLELCAGGDRKVRGGGLDGGDVVHGADGWMINGVGNVLEEITRDFFSSKEQQALDKAVGENAETYLRTSDHTDQLDYSTQTGNQDSVDAASLLSCQRTQVVECLTEAGNNSIPLTDDDVLGSVDSSALELCAGGDQKIRAEVLADSSGGKVTGVEEPVNDAERVGLIGGQEAQTEEPVVLSTRLVSLTPWSSEKVYQASYLLPVEDGREFSVSDLVWGKVKHHPWYPGQIFHPSEASETAMKCQKNGCFLIAYFGDKSFAWINPLLLKPFQQSFTLAANQRYSESFQNAVTCALGEVSRRAELGLACSCMPSDEYEKIQYQSVENAGIRDISIKRDDVDNSFSASSFNPQNLLGYMKGLAQLPLGGANRLELVIAKAQLLSFSRFKGYCQLPEFQLCEVLPEAEEDFTESSYNRRKSGGYNRKKRKRIFDLMSGAKESADNYLSSDRVSKADPLLSGCKIKDTESLARCSSATQTIDIAKVTQTRPNQSLGIGDSIQRVATRRTGSSSMKDCGERSKELERNDNAYTGDCFAVIPHTCEEAQEEQMTIPGGNLSLSDLLSQLNLVAKSPLEHPPLNTVLTFFLGVRSSVIARQQSATATAIGKKRRSLFSPGDAETFAFEDASDSYGKGMTIDNGFKEQPSQSNMKEDSPSVPVDLGESQMNHKPNARKRRSDGNNKKAKKKATQKNAEKKPDLSPTELVIIFPPSASIPSAKVLNGMFRRYGPLHESETEIDEETSRARVIFKRCSDGEIAYSSSRIFKIFGSTIVNYELNYTPTVPFKAVPPAATNDMEDDFADLLVDTDFLFQPGSSGTGGM